MIRIPTPLQHSSLRIFRNQGLHSFCIRIFWIGLLNTLNNCNIRGFVVISRFRLHNYIEVVEPGGGLCQMWIPTISFDDTYG